MTRWCDRGCGPGTDAAASGLVKKPMASSSVSCGAASVPRAASVLVASPRGPVPANPGRGGARGSEPGGVSVDDGRPTPLSTDRIVRWFERNDFHYFTDDDGDLGGLWRGRLFYFFLFGDQQEIVQVRGQWNREIAIERLEEVLDACTEWNAERIWPKAYVRV